MKTSNCQHAVRLHLPDRTGRAVLGLDSRPIGCVCVRSAFGIDEAVRLGGYETGMT